MKSPKVRSLAVFHIAQNQQTQEKNVHSHFLYNYFILFEGWGLEETLEFSEVSAPHLGDSLDRDLTWLIRVEAEPYPGVAACISSYPIDIYCLASSLET